MNDDCQRIDALADELALGQLTGVNRARALAHLEECHACRAEIASLTEVADAVLLLASAVAPDPGFEQRILDRIAPAVRRERPLEGPPPAVMGKRRPGRLRLALAAAAVMIAVVAASLTLAAHRPPGALAATMVDGRGDRVGRLSLVADHHTAVQMDLPGWDRLLGRYGNGAGGGFVLEVTRHDGSRVRVPLPPGHDGTWKVTTPVDRADVTRVAIVDQAGQPWCHADFT